MSTMPKTDRSRLVNDNTKKCEHFEHAHIEQHKHETFEASHEILKAKMCLTINNKLAEKFRLSYAMFSPSWWLIDICYDQ